MKKTILLALCMAGMLACNALVPTPTATSIPTGTEPPSPTLRPTEVVFTPTSTSTQIPVSFKNVRIVPLKGSLDQQLADEAQKAAALGLMPVVEFDAAW